MLFCQGIEGKSVNVSLNDDLEKLALENEPEIIELRNALKRTQKQLESIKQKTDLIPYLITLLLLLISVDEAQS